jgi:prepilin-type N-terminal cleavage/methylation domain-containing protein
MRSARKFVVARSFRGFTLIELLVTVAIAAVLLAIALPNVRNQILAAQARSSARSMQDALDLARQYALNTSTFTTLTPNGCGYAVTAGGATTTTTIASSSNVNSLVIACTPTFSNVSFLGDGSAATCNSGTAGVPCQPLTSNVSFTTSGGGSTWTVTIQKSGLVTMGGGP